MPATASTPGSKTSSAPPRTPAWDTFPSTFWATNLGWAQAICIGVDLLAWLKLLGDLPPDMQRAEPKTLRYRLLSTPARITRGQRHRWLRLPAHWPWSQVLAHAINTIARLPIPALA